MAVIANERGVGLYVDAARSICWRSRFNTGVLCLEILMQHSTLTSYAGGSIAYLYFSSNYTFDLSLSLLAPPDHSLYYTWMGRSPTRLQCCQSLTIHPPTQPLSTSLLVCLLATALGPCCTAHLWPLRSSNLCL